MSGVRWYDRQGRPLTLAQAAPLLEDADYQRVASDVLPDGRWISTVWLGLDHGSFRISDPPLIFETMVFESQTKLHEMRCARYSTEAEALRGHERIWFSEFWISFRVATYEG